MGLCVKANGPRFSFRHSLASTAADRRYKRTHPKLKIQNPKSFLPLLACLAVVLAWFSPWWIGGKNLAPLDLQNLMMSPWRDGNVTDFAKNHIVSDGVDQYLVYRMVAAESYAKEGWLGWSALTYGGTAQYSNTMALYYDWTMQLHRWFDFWTAWHLGLMGQVMLAAAGMFLWLRGRNIGNLWACCGALAYAANSQFVTWIYHRWALSAFCWVPWILWAIDGYRRGNRNFWAAVPVFIAMAFLGGTLQHAALVALAVAAMWLEEALLYLKKNETVMAPCDRRTLSDGKTSDAHKTTPRQISLLGRYALWGILGAGLAAMMLLPCISAFMESNRLGLHMGMNVNAENSVYPKGALQPLFNLAAYPLQIFPWILGRCDSIDVLKLFKSELFYICYFGTLPVMLGYLCLFRKTSPIVARILIAAGLLLPLTPLVRVLYQRLFLLFIVGGILAFAHFMENASRETRLRILRFSGIVTALGLAAWTLVSMSLSFNPKLTNALREKITSEGGGSSFGHFTEWIGMRADRFVADLFIWSPHQIAPLLFLAAGWIGLRWTASISDVWRRRGALLVALVVVTEVTWFAARWVVWSDPVKYPFFPEIQESNALRKEVGPEGRVTTLIHPTSHMAMTPFIPNTLSAYGISTISGYDSIVPDGMILPKESPADAARLGRLAVSHLITWTGNPDVPKEWRELWKSPMMTIYQNTLLVPRYVGFKDTTEKESFFSGRHAQPDQLEETSGMENSRSIPVPAGYQWIRVAENQAPGWQYRVAPDGEWQPVRRATDASMLIDNPNPEVRTLIEMRYDPPLRMLGFVISASSLLLLGIGYRAGCRRQCV
jgi:hypothetical protein